MPKKVAVIILNFNTPVFTIACVKSLKQYSDANLFDIIIADNGSTDSSVELLKKQFPNEHFIDNLQNLGFAEGNNHALRYAIDKGYQYSLLVNSDTIVKEDIITPLADHLDKYPKTAAVQPSIYWMYQPDKLWNGPGSFNVMTGNTVSKTGDNYRQVKDFINVKWGSGCCLMLRNEVLKETGLLNKQFFLYYEDVDLCYRIREYGYDIHYITSAKIFHEAGASSTAGKYGKEGTLNPLAHYYISRNHLWFIRRYGILVLLPLNLIYNLGYYSMLLVYFLIRGRTQKARLLLKGINDGLFIPKSIIWPNDNSN